MIKLINYLSLCIGHKGLALGQALDLEFQNIGFPLLLVPFISRASEVVGNKIFYQFYNK